MLHIEWICGQCPVQSEGTIDGKPYYFRARGERWTLEVGDWKYTEDYGDCPYDAGWMTEEEARRFIEMAARFYLEDTAEPFVLER